METLVVLLITGLVSTLMIQGLTHVLNLRIHFLSFSQKQTSEMLQAYWFYEVASGLFPGYPDEKNSFFGDKTHFQGLSIAPLKGIKGVPTLIKMELVFENREIILQYQEQNGEIWEICRWKGNNASFSYLDKENQWHLQWIPLSLSEEEPTQLPFGILLEIKEDIPVPVVWFASVQGRHDPAPRIRDLISGL